MPRFEKSLDALNLINLLQSRAGMTNRQIAREFDWGIKKAQRMTEMLSFNASETGLFSIINIAPEGERVQCWQIPRSRLPRFSLEEDEIAFLLTLLENTENRHPGGKQKTEGMIRKIRSLHPKSDTYRFEDNLDFLMSTTSRLRQPGPRDSVDPDLYRTLGEAIQSWWVIDILFQTKGESEWITVWPLGLLHGERNYLVAREISKARSNRRNFRLPDIQEIRTTGEVFNLGEDGFNLSEHMLGAFGVFQNEQKWEVVWIFDEEVRYEVAGYQFHPGQEVEQLDDKRTRVSFSASGLVEMCHELFKWGKHIEIESPKELGEMYDAMRTHKWSRWGDNPWETRPDDPPGS